MNRILTLLCTLLVIVTNAYGDVIGGFDGFKWGSSRNDIIQVRGAPMRNYGTSATWTPEVGESIGDYGVRLIWFYFREGCSELKETISEPCSLWAGTYLLTTTSRSDVDALTVILSEKYGQYEEDTKTVDEREFSSGKFLAKVTTVCRIWEASDKSAVRLYWKSYDRDFSRDFVSNSHQKKGIFAVGVRYLSADYIENEERKQTIKKKSF